MGNYKNGVENTQDYLKGKKVDALTDLVRMPHAESSCWTPPLDSPDIRQQTDIREWLHNGKGLSSGSTYATEARHKGYPYLGWPYKIQYCVISELFPYKDCL